MNLKELKEKSEAPEWMNEESFNTVSSGYMQEGETPRNMYKRAAEFSAKVYDNKAAYEADFMEAIWKNWLCLATPVLSNGNTKNLQISCYSSQPKNTMGGIMDHLKELAMLTKRGGGCGSSFDSLNAESGDIIPFYKMKEAVVEGTKQGKNRRGAVGTYLNIKHRSAPDFINIRSQTGDLSRKCQSVAFHNAITIDDDIMNRIVDGDEYYRNLYHQVMNQRVETGEPYLLFQGNANKNCPAEYEGTITQSNLCSEIMAPVTPTETFVCCLSSLNLARYDEWKDYKFPNTGLTLIELSIYFLDAVITNFIKQTDGMEGMENARRFATRHRMLGLGALGWHSLLQSKFIPFESYQAMQLNNEIFKKMREESYKASYDLGKLFGNCEVVPTRRNSALLAVAPTMSNSLISGGVSQGIEPITANIFSQKAAKGTFIKRNPALEAFLKSEGLDKVEIWEQINKDRGSVRNIKQMGEDAKKVFLTAREINQFALITQASQRQRWIDQGQSLNLFFSLPNNKDESAAVAKYMNEVHLEAWKSGVKSLYYMKTDSPLKGDIIAVDKEGACLSCEG